MTHGPGSVARDGFEIDKLVPGYHQCAVYSVQYTECCTVYSVHFTVCCTMYSGQGYNSFYGVSSLSLTSLQIVG